MRCGWDSPPRARREGTEADTGRVHGGGGRGVFPRDEEAVPPVMGFEKRAKL